MRSEHLQLMVCPKCRESLKISRTDQANGDRIEDGGLTCLSCATEYPIVSGVPRFVARENYASGFGLEWNLHARTQYDSTSGLTVSKDRFFGQTHWPPDLTGSLILEVGSGSGRFTEQAAQTGATVVSFDYSYAVDANYRSNGQLENVLIVQADVFAMPFRDGTFDRLFCFGMLQHTPDAKGALAALERVLKPGGAVCADIYKATLLRTWLHTKYLIRPLVRHLEPDRLYTLVKRWVDFMWPLATVIRKLPKGHGINWRLMVADYSPLGLKGDALKEWAYLDTFDMLSPKYDLHVRSGTFHQWAEEAGYTGVETEYSGHGVTLRATKPRR
jgi:ubiquinone/menaquinone biosynthesis C-methylase UbiE/uncharacterized protein YbaR (Trm112 family)